MKRIKSIDRKLLRRFTKYGDAIAQAEVFCHPNPTAAGGGILIITDGIGERFYEDRSLNGLDACLKIARHYK